MFLFGPFVLFQIKGCNFAPWTAEEEIKKEVIANEDAHIPDYIKKGVRNWYRNRALRKQELLCPPPKQEEEVIIKNEVNSFFIVAD